MIETAMPPDPATLQMLRNRLDRVLREGDDYVWCLDTDSGQAFWWVMSPAGEVYEVDIYGRNCSCPDYQFRCKIAGVRCKHLIALKNGMGKWDTWK